MLSRKTRYAIMAMTALARNYGKGPLPMSLIASTKNIPLRFLEGILLQLKKKGFLISVRGIDGGYSLSKAPGEITLMGIIEATEGSFQFVSCLNTCGEDRCEFGWDLETCGIRNVFSQMFADVQTRLGSTSLLDLI